MSSDVVVDITNTRKRYSGGVDALRGISLQVPRGGIFGLLGPNGAGKSTLVKILMTIVHPTTCDGTMLGERIGHKPTLSRVGYLPEHARFPDFLSGEDVVQYVAGLVGVPRSVAKSRGKELIEMVGMKEWGKRKMKTYSKGMKQRIALAQAMVNNPEIIFLDEPTDGVDPKGRLEMRALLQRMRDEGMTVFINSHLLGELEMICDSVAILDQGRVVRQGTIDALTEKSRRFEIRIEGSLSPTLRDKLYGDGVMIEGQTMKVFTPEASGIQPIIDALRAEQVTIAEMKMVRQSLEELFMESVQGDGVGARKQTPSMTREEIQA